MQSIGPGTLVADAYRVERRIGSGAMGAVYEAILIGTGERVAIKIPHEAFRSDRSAMKRFAREARASLSIRSPHVVNTLAVGRLSCGTPLMAMEYVEAGTLLDAMYPKDGGRMPTWDVLEMMRQMACGLQAAHEVGVIHRDLKPDNVFLCGGTGRRIAKIFDFGLSLVSTDTTGRLTKTGMVFGTPQYMAPEQVRSTKHVDERVDIYALGVIAYEMLTQRWPFGGASAHEVWNRIVNDSPAPPSVWRPDLSSEICAVVMKAMARDAADRYEKASELRRVVSELLW